MSFLEGKSLVPHIAPLPGAVNLDQITDGNAVGNNQRRPELTLRMKKAAGLTQEFLLRTGGIALNQDQLFSIIYLERNKAATTFGKERSLVERNNDGGLSYVQTHSERYYASDFYKTGVGEYPQGEIGKAGFNNPRDAMSYAHLYSPETRVGRVQSSLGPLLQNEWQGTVRVRTAQNLINPVLEAGVQAAATSISSRAK